MKEIAFKLKKILPSVLYSLLKRIYININRKIYMLKATIYLFPHIKKINKRKRDYDKPKIVFFLQYPETWNAMKSVYCAAEKNGANVCVLCERKPIFSGGVKEGMQEINEAYIFCKANNIRAIEAYDRKSNLFFDLEKYSPDYVFYARPYHADMPEPYRSYNVCKYAKVCNIHYATDTGYDLNGGETNLHTNFVSYTYFKFLNSKRFVKPYKKRFGLQCRLGLCHYRLCGYPKFDLLKETNLCTKNRHKTIAWLPRWVVEKKDELNFESHFLEYINPMMSYMSAHSKNMFIIRPHPLMWSELIRKGFMSNEEVNDLKCSLNSMENVTIDEKSDYLDTINDADILVSDFTSIMVEFFVSGKPIIYCNEIDNSVDKSMKGMYESCYLANSWNEVENYLDTLIDGDDYKQNERMAIIRDILPENKGHIGESVYNCILEDFNKYHKSTN